jgi:hypothetical protein
MLRYVGGKRVRIRGSASGNLYEFTGGERMPVTLADVPMMLHTGLFAKT